MIWKKQNASDSKQTKKQNTEGNRKPTLYFMFAPWCGHSKKAKPEWDKLVEEKGDVSKNVSLVLVNSEDNESK